MLDIEIKKLIEVTGGQLVAGDIDKYGSERISGITYDSRTTGRGLLFVPIVGEKVDAHRFIADVLAGETIISLTERSDIEYSGDRILVKVNNSVDAVRLITEYYRNNIRVPVIGVTGSVGKTTTREMISLALSAEKKVYATPGNRNSQLGVPQAVFGFKDDSDMAVMEMGISMPGEMEKLVRMVRPDAAVITNIGITHIENLGSREEILRQKMHITDRLPDDAPVFLNDDNDMLHSYKLPDRLKKITYGLNDKCDVYAADIDTTYGCSEFNAIVNGKSIHVNLNVYGTHMIYNSLVALAVCDWYGVDLSRAAEKLSTYAGYQHRSQIFHNGSVTVIDDTYNAAPDSMRAAIDMLGAIKCNGRRIAVLGDMKELGEITEDAHISIGKYAADKGCVDLLISYGKYASKMDEGFGDNTFVHTEDADELEKILFEEIQPGDLVLFKGSNSMKLFDFADKVIKHEFM